jgi:hypothetical protein
LYYNEETHLGYCEKKDLLLRYMGMGTEKASGWRGVSRAG